MATITPKFAFNPFTGTFDVTVADVAVDRLTSTNSTLILSDSGGNQTLTGNLGTLIISPAGEMTVNAQLTAEKFIAVNTTTGASRTLGALSHQLTLTTGFDFSAYIGLDIDIDSNVNGASAFSGATFSAINIDLDFLNTLSSGNLSGGRFLNATLAYPSSMAPMLSPIYVATTAPSTSQVNFSDGAAYLFAITAAGASGKMVCLRTEARCTANGAFPIGYEGFATMNGGNGTALGVHGLAVSGGATSVLIGVQGEILLPGSCPINRRTSVLGSSGHMICSVGSLWVTSAAVTYAGAITTTHLDPTTSVGSGYFTGALEVDGVGYFDNATTAIQVGAGAAGVDYRILFDGETADGVLTWMEDEDYFQFADDVMIPTNERIYFGNTSSSIRYDGTQLNLNDDANIILSSPIVTVGNAGSGVDILLKFDGETTDGYLYWKEDEAYFEFGDDVRMSDAQNLIFDTSTGTKIGTAATQKIGFWNATPVVQQAHIADADGTLADITTKFNSLLTKLEALGLTASA